jgi:glycosyltransferase involved in cell wall biosynthesis
MEATVVIPAFNERRAIARCLEALLRQVSPGVEVIVADDGSTDGTPDEIGARFPGVRLLRLPHRGSAAARSAALAEARGARIAFLDADCVPDQGWLDAARRGDGLVMGRVRCEPAFRARLVAVLDFGEFLGETATELANFALLNVAGPADLFRRIPLPDVAHSHDRLWSSLLVRAGHRIRYEPAQCVLHAPPLDARAFWRRRTSYARRFIAARRLDPSLPGGRLLRLGPFAAPLLAGGRLWRDLGRLVRVRRALGIGSGLPCYAAALAGLRTVDMFLFAPVALKGWGLRGRGRR